MHIGLFDSGVGGLTVLREVQARIPGSRLTYLGDTARLPYGNKAPETLKKYTLENIAFLDSQDVDVIVIACHSASSIALDLLESSEGTPIFNVISPSCAEAVLETRSGQIGVLATKATTRSLVYPKHINRLDPNVKVHSQEAPLLVPLVEEGHLNDEISKLVLKTYLSPLKAHGIDTLILGCTHYPILKDGIQEFFGQAVHLIDPARSVADRILQQLQPTAVVPELQIYLTDHAPHFLIHAQNLLGTTKKLEILHPS